MRTIRIGSLIGALAALVLTAPANAAITEFVIEPGSAPGAHAPRYVKPGPDGNLWFTDGGTSPGVGRVTPSGQMLPQIADANAPVDMVFVPRTGAAFWSADKSVNRRLATGELTPAVNTFPSYAIVINAIGELIWSENINNTVQLCHATGPWWTARECRSHFLINGRVTDLELVPDGTLWGVFNEAGRVIRLQDDGAPRDPAEQPFVPIPPGSGPTRMTTGPDGNLWVTMADAGAIDRITLAGVRTRFPLPTGSRPGDIVAGADGALWFTELGTNKIGRMTTAGVLTNEFPIPTPNAQPLGIAAAADGTIWFTETAAGRIGHWTPDPPAAGGPGGAPGGAGTGGGAAGGAGGPAVGGAGFAADTTPPAFTEAPAFSPRTFAVSSRSTAVSARTTKGSKLQFALSESATVTVKITRSASGRRVGGRCVATTSKNRRRSRCTRTITMGSLRRDVGAGAVTIAFSGRIGRQALGRRTYKAAITAMDDAGNVSRTATAGFTIVRAS